MHWGNCRGAWGLNPKTAGHARVSKRLFVETCDWINGKWSGRRGSNSQLSAWEFELALLYFQYLQNRSRKINVHATHTMHALPDLRVAAGRLRDGFRPLGLQTEDRTIKRSWARANARRCLRRP